VRRASIPKAVPFIVLLVASLLTSVGADAREVISSAQEPVASGDLDTPTPVSGDIGDGSTEDEGRSVELTLGFVPASPAAREATVIQQALDGAVSLEIDDGDAETSLGVTSGSSGVSFQFIWLNRFSPAVADFPLILEQIQVFFDGIGQGASVGDAIDLVVYRDADGNPANGATWLATYSETVKAADGTNWSVYDLDPAVTISSPGDVLIGVINRYVSSSSTPANYPAALDESASQRRSWIGWWNGDPPDPAVLPPTSSFDLVDDINGSGVPGNWMIRGYGQTGSGTGENTVVYLPMVTLNEGGCPAGTLTPNDPSFSLQWGMRKIQAPRAWFCGFQGDREVVVAVIDTGVDLEHPEFAGKLVEGWDWANDDGRPDDDHGHGSHVAGIIGALSNNGTGVAGVAWDTRIMPLKTLRGDGVGYTSWSIAAVTWAADHGADVINMSLGSVFKNQAYQDAINYAHSKGVLVVASAGNCGDGFYYLNGCSYQDQPSYPGAYNNVMAVASTTQTDGQSSFSTQGSYVDIAAPGSSIYSTKKDGGYGYLSGTSQAAPHVAGLAALVKAAHPDYEPDQIQATIQEAAVDLDPTGKDIQFGWGRIDAAVALGLAFPAGSAVESVMAEVQPLTRESGAEIAPGTVLVKFRSDVSRSAAVATLADLDLEVQIASTNPQIGLLELAVPVGSEWDVVESLRAMPEVEYAEPDPAIFIQ
jgi:subtilisin family serine protease